ncbi:MAG: DNA topoisomerase I [Planctomycetaceae bacterium]
MGSLFRALFHLPILQTVMRPVTRFLVGAIAIPLFRIFLRNVVRLQELDRELEKDLEQWFRGTLLLLVASANMEEALFGWVSPALRLEGDFAWVGVALRLLLAVGVIEAMPDQELFAVIHPGPPKLRLRQLYSDMREKFWAVLWGLFCKHLNRTSPVFVILTAIIHEPTYIGWVCYGLAIFQYLIIGLVTSRDKAMDVLGEFDRQVAVRRREIIEEFDLNDHPSPADATDGPRSPESGGGVEKTATRGYESETGH